MIDNHASRLDFFGYLTQNKYSQKYIMDNLSTRLSELSKLMEDCATELSMYCDSLLYADKADELYKCSGVVKEWAETMKAEKE
ncbi:MAG TPA: hypothetical protein VFM18_11445 [Methanosarcina sp.]|nr:hypothetical protein [Methanosarcina sp.]